MNFFLHIYYLFIQFVHLKKKNITIIPNTLSLAKVMKFRRVSNIIKYY